MWEDFFCLLQIGIELGGVCAGFCKFLNVVIFFDNSRSTTWFADLTDLVRNFFSKALEGAFLSWKFSWTEFMERFWYFKVVRRFSKS